MAQHVNDEEKNSSGLLLFNVSIVKFSYLFAPCRGFLLVRFFCWLLACGTAVTRHPAVSFDTGNV